MRNLQFALNDIADWFFPTTSHATELIVEKIPWLKRS